MEKNYISKTSSALASATTFSDTMLFRSCGKYQTWITFIPDFKMTKELCPHIGIYKI